MSWYERIAGQPQQPVQNGFSGIQFPDPIQKANYIRQAMVNPGAFVRQVIPGMPAEISNDPNRILEYMKQNCGVTDADIQRAAMQIPRF